MIITAVAVVALTVIGFMLQAHPVDQQLSAAFNTAHISAAGAFSSAVYLLFGPVPAIGLTIATATVIGATKRHWRSAAAFAGVVALTWIPSDLVKILVHRPRPDAYMLIHPFSPAQLDASYPSGHAVFIGAFVIALLYLLSDTRWFSLGVVVGIGLVAAVALALVIDGVHYPTHVLASILWFITVAPAARVIWVDWILVRLRHTRQ
jgi:membrane-associated phospholipid phosphatase